MKHHQLHFTLCDCQSFIVIKTNHLALSPLIKHITDKKGTYVSNI